VPAKWRYRTSAIAKLIGPSRREVAIVRERCFTFRFPSQRGGHVPFRFNMHFTKLQGVIEFIDPATLKTHSARLQRSHSKYPVTLMGFRVG